MNAGDEFVIDCILAESSLEELWQLRAAARDEIKRRLAQKDQPQPEPLPARRTQLVELDPTPKGHLAWIN